MMIEGSTFTVRPKPKGQIKEVLRMKKISHTFQIWDLGKKYWGIKGKEGHLENTGTIATEIRIVSNNQKGIYLV